MIKLTSWTRYQLLELIRHNDEMVRRSLVMLYHRQTVDEKQRQETKHQNGRGFNAFDAPALIGLAECYLRTRHLSPQQIYFIRKKLLKYIRQIQEEANHGTIN